MQEIRDFTLGIVLGHQLEDMQAFWPPGMQSFAYSIGLKKQFSRFLPPKKSIFFHFWPKSEIDLPVPGRDRGWNISLLGEGKQVQVKSTAAEAPSRCCDPPKSRFFPIKKSIFFIFDLSRKLTCRYREGMGVGI